MPKKKKKRAGKYFLIFILLLLVLISLFWLARGLIGSTGNDYSEELNKTAKDSIGVDSNSLKKEFVEAAFSDADSNDRVIYVSSPSDTTLGPKYFDENAGKPYKRIYNGRRINIVITGVDARVNTKTKHADANHVLSILVDSGVVEIISIPRDTPADAGYDDSTGQNKLTVLHAAKGKKAYEAKVAEIAGLDKIHYYIEAGFSQVMGVLEFLGFKESGSALQVLRSRKVFGGDDYQRTYNQAQFIKQMMIKHFSKFDGVMGDILLRGALAMITTDLDYSTAKKIITDLRAKGFPRDNNSITIRIRPPIPIKYKIYDFNDPKVVKSMESQIEHKNSKESLETFNADVFVKSILWDAIEKAKKDTLSRPNNVINGLSTIFEQRAWLQVKNINERSIIRNQIALMLSRAYEKKKQPDKAKKIREIVADEEKLFQNSIGN
jgi:anionic cell wall polymer biosynthesis LytR-Cps2A-Psr (LCP) family protein